MSNQSTLVQELLATISRQQHQILELRKQLTVNDSAWREDHLALNKKHIALQQETLALYAVLRGVPGHENDDKLSQNIEVPHVLQ